jgi:hypothetical protein
MERTQEMNTSGFISKTKKLFALPIQQTHFLIIA